MKTKNIENSNALHKSENLQFQNIYFDPMCSLQWMHDMLIKTTILINMHIFGAGSVLRSFGSA